MTDISTLIFFDLETTGLPWQEKNQTKITELSFIAALAQDIRITPLGLIPPVKKLTLIFNPQRRIHPEASALNGLTNRFLKDAPVFKDKVNDLIQFIDGLSKPVCLVAHNGNIFDYKIFLAECNDAMTSLPEDLLCLDSLVTFRTLLKGKSISYSDFKKLDSIEDLISNDEVEFTDDEDEWPLFNISIEDWEEIDDLCVSLTDTSLFNNSQEMYKAKIKSNDSLEHKKSVAIKNIFKEKTKPIKHSYSLTALYKRLLNREDDNAHRAESDCMMLLHCVVAMKKDFLHIANNLCKPLSEIQPLIRK